MKSGAWNSTSEVIIISVDEHGLGTFNYTIVITDVGSNSVSDMVLAIVVDGTVPTIDSPPDVEYTEGEIGNQIEWQTYDLHPLAYEILRNGVSLLTETWETPSGSIVIQVDGLAAGVYNYMIIVTDVGGNTALDSVTVTVAASSTTTSLPTTNVTQMEFPNFLLIITVCAGGTIIIVIIVIVISSKRGPHGK